MRSSLPITVILLSPACVEDIQDAELLLPGPIDVAWEGAYDGENDGLGALIPVDVMAYDGASGRPLTNVELEVWAESGTAWPVPVEQVVVVEPDDECTECELLWDAERDEFLHEISVVDILPLSTDADGLARLYLYVDTFPEGDGGADFGDLAVLVSMGTTEETFLLLPR